VAPASPSGQGVRGAVGDDPDALYQPLTGPEGWHDASAGVDTARWRAGVERLAAMAEDTVAWTDMVRRGMVLMAAYRSGAMAGLYDDDDVVAHRLLAGTAAPRACGPVAGPHVVAIHAAVAVAAEAGTEPGIVSEAWIRRLHAVACRPQQTHPVVTDHGVHDHVLGHGDYKHHPNHARAAAGGWHPFVPVCGVGAEMANLVGWLGGPSYAALHPAARAAYALHGLHHVGPFAAGSGRVARALASGALLAAGSAPLAGPSRDRAAYHEALDEADRGDHGSLVRLVERWGTGLLDITTTLRDPPASPDQTHALDRWQARVQAGHRLQAMLPAAVERALARHGRRTDLGWMADLAAASVECTGSGDGAPRFDSPPLSIRVVLDAGSVAEELLVIDPHPVTGEGEAVVIRAKEAELEIEVRPEDVSPLAVPAVGRRLDALLERAVTALAVRVAAETAPEVSQGLV